MRTPQFVVASMVLLLPLLSPSWGAPFTDVPDGHPAAAAITRLVGAGILTPTGGAFQGEMVADSDFLVAVGARLIAFVSLRLVREDSTTPLDLYVRGRSAAMPPPVDGVPVPETHPDYAAHVFVRQVEPDQAKEFLAATEGLTRYGVAEVVARVLARVEAAQKRAPVALVPSETDAPDWEFDGQSGPIAPGDHPPHE